ncbi:MAG: PaaI family thioesterase [Rhizomicrobium sp.]
MSERPSGLPDGAEEASGAAFGKYVGPVWRLPDGEDGALKRYALIVTDVHMNSAGSVHGGMLMTLADMAMSQTSRLMSGAKSSATVSLNCDFVAPGRLGDLIEAQVRVTRKTRTMVFVSAELVSAGRVILVATGLWKILVDA